MADILMDKASVVESLDNKNDEDVGAPPVAFNHTTTSKARRRGLFGVAKGSRVQPRGTLQASLWVLLVLIYPSVQR
jgi:hypothetical protein